MLIVMGSGECQTRCFSKSFRSLIAIFCFVLSAYALQTPANPTAPANQTPVIDGEIGPCAVLFTVTDATGKPARGAKIEVHIAYGFLSVRKLDLEVGTNSDGKAGFRGLPDKVKRPLYFRASQGDRQGAAFYDPAKNCTAEHNIVLEQSSGTHD